MFFHFPKKNDNLSKDGAESKFLEGPHHLRIS